MHAFSARGNGAESDDLPTFRQLQKGTILFSQQNENKWHSRVSTGSLTSLSHAYLTENNFFADINSKLKYLHVFLSKSCPTQTRSKISIHAKD